MHENRTYYQHVAELQSGESLQTRREVSESLQKGDILSLLDGTNQIHATRRNFLKLAGFSAVLGTVVNSCEKPIQKAIPYLIKPEEITPGQSVYYATSFFDGEEFCGILVRSRDGRPIKIEGNPVCPLGRGGTSARVQASVLGLYDEDRYRGPLKDGKDITWEASDAEISKQLKAISSRGGKIVLLSSTLISPSALKIIDEFISQFPGSRHMVYDTVSASGMLEANLMQFGIRAIPAYRFDQADLIVGFDADFLGSWISPAAYTYQYANGRRLSDNGAKMNRHVQFETTMTITGSNADIRYPVLPSAQKSLLIHLLALLKGIQPEEKGTDRIEYEALKELSAELKLAAGKSLVVSGSNDPACQMLVNQINHLLGNYGHTIDFTDSIYLRQGSDREVILLAEQMERNEIEGLVFLNTNPLYHFPNPEIFTRAMERNILTVSLSTFRDETASACRYICPSSHFLESWGDARPSANHYALQQPLISNIFNTRQWEETLLAWMGRPASMEDRLRGYWESDLFDRQTLHRRKGDFWAHSVQQGVFIPGNTDKGQPDFQEISVELSIRTLPGIEVQLYQTVAMGTGKHANNPWLHEMPDPVSKAVWDNYIAVSPRFAEEQGLTDFDVIEINEKISLPVLIQPGQAYGTLSVAMGYGRQKSGRVADGVGVNVFPLAAIDGESISFATSILSIKKTNRKYTVARSQIFSELDGRPIVRETILPDYRENAIAGNELHKEIEEKHVSLYDDPVYNGFHWGLSVDLNSCTGCGACLIACQAENNVPVVGKAEVAKSRIMHWIRIDRYYAGNSDNPDVVHQPVMCMHCDNAPCENVCPVSATPHSDEGLNQVAYTRCIGTKYCINNCPYKVRKFNWYQYVGNPKFNFHANSDLGRLVLNPDVTVRERGVVEKCSFCAQRIQEKKLEAKLQNRVLDGSEVKTACVQACPAKALVFGDLNNRQNEVTRLFSNERNYFVLEELHMLPSVGYLTKVRNRGAGEISGKNI